MLAIEGVVSRCMASHCQQPFYRNVYLFETGVNPASVAVLHQLIREILPSSMPKPPS